MTCRKRVSPSVTGWPVRNGNNGSNCQSDLDSDADVDGGDLVAFISAYTEMRSDADLDENGFIDAGDVEIAAGDFGRDGCE